MMISWIADALRVGAPVADERFGMSADDMAEAILLLEDALFLHTNGERPPGAPAGNPDAETWADWGRRCQEFLRAFPPSAEPAVLCTMVVGANAALTAVDTKEGPRGRIVIEILSTHETFAPEDAIVLDLVRRP